MKKALIILLILTAVTAIYKQVATPDYIRINTEMVQACTMDMQADANLICD